MASLALALSVTSDLGTDRPGWMQQTPDDPKILAQLIDVRMLLTYFEDQYNCLCERQLRFTATKLLKDLCRRNSSRVLTRSRAEEMQLKCLGANFSKGLDSRVVHGP
jgi:hypothetical protein